MYDFKYDIAEFFDLFIKSGIAERFETGDFIVIAGMSGVELAYEVTMYTAAKPEANLKLMRQKVGLSQRQLADLSGIPVRTIQQYERKTSCPQGRAEGKPSLARTQLHQ